MIQRGSIPVQTNFKNLNPKISRLEPDKMELPARTQRWNGTAVCVNNYGAAGSNVAMIVCKAPKDQAPQEDRQKPATALNKCPLLISAHSEKSIRAYCTALRCFLTKGNGLDNGLGDYTDILFELAHQVNPTLSTSFAICVTSLAELQVIVSDQYKFMRTQHLGVLPKRPTVLCFGGQTKACVGLSECFYKNVLIFQMHLDCCDSTCRSLGITGFYPKIFSKSPIEDIVLLQCMLFSLQYACANSWIDCGLQVSAVIGHSFGQLTALCVSGSMSLLQAMQLISGRAKLIKDLWGPERGTMLSVESDEQTVRKLLSLANQTSEYCVEIACFNSPSTHVLTGSEASIEALESRLREYSTLLGDIKVRRLDVTHGFHSHLVDPILPQLTELINCITFHEPRLQIETCSKDRSWTRIDANAVTQLSREPVYFSEAVNRIAKEKGACNWIEAGTDSGIVAMARWALGTSVRAEHRFQPLSLTSAHSVDLLADATVNMWQSGLRVQFWPYHRLQRQDYKKVFLPPYQFEKHPHWLDYKEISATKATVDQARSPTRKLLSFVSFMRPQNSTQSLAEYTIDPESHDFKIYVQGHKVLGSSSCPASLYIHLAAQALAGVCETENNSSMDGTFCIEDLNMRVPLGLDAQKMISLSLESSDHTAGTWAFRICSLSSTDTLKVANHASGVAYLAKAESPAAIRPQRTSDGLETSIEGSFIYSVFSTVVEYAQCFRGMRKISARGSEVTGLISSNETSTVLPQIGTIPLCDPLMIDNILQVAGLYLNCLRERKPQTVYVCTHIQRFQICLGKEKQHFEPLNVACHVVSANETHIACHITASSAQDQKTIVQILGARFAGVPIATLTRTLANLGSTKLSNFISYHAASVEDGEKEIPNVYPSANSHVATVEPDDCPGTVVVPIEHHVSEDLNSQVNGSKYLEEDSTCFIQLQQLLSKVTDVPIKDMRRRSLLQNIGVDSLMTIEVLDEIQKVFMISITMSEFEEAKDLESLCSLVKSKNLQKLRRVIAPPEPVIDSNIVEDLQGSDLPNILDDGSKTQGATTSNNPVANSEGATIVGKINPEPSSTRVHSPEDSELLEVTWDEFTRIANDTQLSGFTKYANDGQFELVVAYIVEAFQILGCNILQLESGDPVSVPFVPQYTALMKQLYHILGNACLIHIYESGSIRSATSIKGTPSHEILQRLLHDFPQHFTELRLLGTMGPHLADFLCGNEDPVHILFGDKANKGLLTEVYTKAPIFATGTRLLASFLSKSIATKSPVRPIRVLEVGGGVGGTTASIIEFLDSLGHPFTYTFTDISSSLVAAAKKRFMGHDSMEFMVMDIETEPQDYLLRSKDIIIATNVIHATKSLKESCSHMRKMLYKKGLLCLVELTRNLDWYDLVFGLLDGWWRFEDGRKHAIADVDTWKQSLFAAGFEHVVWTGDGTEEGDLIRLITAIASDERSIPESSAGGSAQTTMETMVFKYVDRIPLYADIYYPNEIQKTSSKRPIGIFSSRNYHNSITQFFV